MPGAPAFWKRDGNTLPQLVLRPLGAVTAALTARRLAQAGWQAPVPVICCGNVTVGGAGKTTLALDLLRRLNGRGVHAHALLRGYRGSVHGAHRVAPSDDARRVGDEALLLAQLAPTWVGADRATSARAAIAAGAEVLVLDDGLQNPTLRKDMSLLVIDGGFGFGNGHLLPAGPLREPVAAASVRCRAAILIGADEHGAMAALAPTMQTLHASLAPGPEAADFVGRRILAFAGIARPEKLFASLEQVGAVLVAKRAFADHHSFTSADMRRIEEDAARLEALPVTTAKDAARLAPADRPRVRVLTVSLAWRDESEIESLLTELLERRG